MDGVELTPLLTRAKSVRLRWPRRGKTVLETLSRRMAGEAGLSGLVDLAGLFGSSSLSGLFGSTNERDKTDLSTR